PSIRLAPFREVTALPLDPAVLAFTLAVAVITGVLFSCAPMLAVARGDAAGSLKSAGERGGTARLTLVRSVLVGAEVALALMVLAAAGLMIKSVARLVAVDAGVDARNVLLMDMSLPQPDTYGPPLRRSFCDDVTRE